MAIPIEELTPRQIVNELDRYIVGQSDAKRAVAVALRNRFRRQRVDHQKRNDILPKNILMIGPTGVGKTEIARRLAQLARAPFVKVEATKFTEVGYVGRDVESMVRDLAAAAVRLVEAERMAEIAEVSKNAALKQIAQQLDPTLAETTFWPFDDAQEEKSGEDEATKEARRTALCNEILDRKHDQMVVTVEIEEPSSPFLQVFTPQGMEEMGLDVSGNSPFGSSSKRITRTMPVSDALPVLIEAEGKRRLDHHSVNKEAIYRAEQTGIIFIDEIDKVAMKSGGSGPDVSREGVQRDLLPIIEGSTVQSKFGPIRTDHVLFIAAGAFHQSKPSDLVPELQGRLPIRVHLDALAENDFARILREPKNALTRQYEALLEVEGVTVRFEDSALDEIAKVAYDVNKKTANIGARRLHTLMERLLASELFEAPECGPMTVTIDKAMVQDRLGSILESKDAIGSDV